MPQSHNAVASSSRLPAPKAHTYRPLDRAAKTDNSPRVFWDAFTRAPRQDGEHKSCVIVPQSSENDSSSDTDGETFRIGSVVMVEHTTPFPIVGLITQMWTMPPDSAAADKTTTEEEEDEDEDFVPMWCKVRFLYWPTELTRATQTRLKGLIAQNEIFYTHRLPRFGPGSRRTNRSQAAADDSPADNFAQGHSLLESDGFTVSDILGHAYIYGDRNEAAAASLQNPSTIIHQGRTIDCHLYCCKAVDPMKELFWTIDYDRLMEQGRQGKGWDIKVAEDNFKGKPLTTWADEERKRARKEGTVVDLTYTTTETENEKPRKAANRRTTKTSSTPKKRPPKTKKHSQKDLDDQASSSSSSSASGSDSDSDSDFASDTEEDEASDYHDSGSDEEYINSRKRRRTAASHRSTPRKNRRTSPFLAKPTPRSRRIIDLRKEARTQMQDRNTNASSGAFLPNPTSSLPFDFASSAELEKMAPSQRAKRLLHVATTPSTLPCRSSQAENLLCLLEDSLDSGLGSCIYISGVPGTGKTATVRGVIAQLQQRSAQGEVNPFDFLEINGMKVADAAEAYSMLWSVVGDRGSGGNAPVRRRSPKAALSLLSKHYSSTAQRSIGRAATVVLMDELDQLLTSRQDVMYNLFNWPSSRNSRLIVVAVANTMDLPERTLNPKVASRLGMTRITFMPYTDKELGEIVRTRLGMGKEGAALKEEAQKAVDKAQPNAQATGDLSLPLSESDAVNVDTMAIQNGDHTTPTKEMRPGVDAAAGEQPPQPPLIDADSTPQTSPTSLSRHRLYLSAISGCDGIFNDEAITFASKRISNVSGDARRMLDVCRRAVEMKESSGTDTRITIHDIRQILDGMVKSARPSHISRSLSVHSKILLVSLLHLTRKTGLQEIKMEELETRWRGACRMHSVNVGGGAMSKKQTELSLHPPLLLSIDTLVQLGLVILVGGGVGPGKARGWARVMLAQGLREDEVRLALEGDEDARVRGML